MSVVTYQLQWPEQNPHGNSHSNVDSLTGSGIQGSKLRTQIKAETQKILKKNVEKNVFPPKNVLWFKPSPHKFFVNTKKSSCS